MWTPLFRFQRSIKSGSAGRYGDLRQGTGVAGGQDATGEGWKQNEHQCVL